MKLHRKFQILTATAALSALANTTLADDRSNTATDQVVEKLEAAGLDAAVIENIQKQLETTLAGADADAGASATTIVIDGHDTEALNEKIAAELKKAGIGGKLAVGLEGIDTDVALGHSAFLIGPDGEMQALDLDDKNAGKGIKAALKAMMTINGEEIDLDLDSGNGFFGIGPAVIMGDDKKIEIDLSGFDNVKAPAGKSVRAEIKALRTELAEQREMLEKILEAVK